MSPQSSPLNDLPPEVFPIVASLLPLHMTPSTLLSLSLVNHRISSIVLPLVSSRLILKNEEDALKVIQMLLDEPERGKVVRELHILSDLSLATRNGKNPFDVVRGLEKVIAAGSLPFMHTLGLQLLTGWHYDDEFQSVEGFGELRSGFLDALRKNCPRLRGLVLRGIGDIEHEWLEESGLLEIQDITSLTMMFQWSTLSEEAGKKLLKNIASLCRSLHTLDLDPRTGDWLSADPLFALDFPHLCSLSLANFSLGNTDEAMAFWERHPTLEYLKIATLYSEKRWFTKNLPSEFLPKLKHLKAHFDDVRALTPVLHQLVGLTVYGTVNAQIPYLLRFVLPDGLPTLKSLNIQQLPSASGKNVNIEGALWYETEDGKFMEAKVQKASRTVVDGYMHSIARGVPNLEEIGFSSYSMDLEKIAEIASEFAGLSKLQRFYFKDNQTSLSDMSEEERDAFVASARSLAEACSELTTMVDVSRVNLPFVTARIRRDAVGEVDKVDLVTGYGIQIGSDDEAFPDSE